MPTLVRIDYWVNGGWETGHNGINLIDPAAYIAALGKRGVIARAVEPFTKTVIADELEDLL